MASSVPSKEEFCAGLFMAIEVSQPQESWKGSGVKHVENQESWKESEMIAPEDIIGRISAV